MVSFSEAVRLGFSKYADFSGRATRAEYWWWYLFTVLAMWGLLIVGSIIDEDLGLILCYGAWFGTFLPSLAVSVRRLHDSGHSGFYLLWAFVPIVGAILILIALLQESKDGDDSEETSANTGAPSAASTLDAPEVEPNADPKELCSNGVILYKAGNYDRAVVFLKQAAQLGNAKALCTLGLCYQKGQGVEKNPAIAVDLYKKAAEKNNKAAFYYLGLCYEKGIGVEKDLSQARNYLKKAAELGHSSAATKLDSM